jgi:hypothetical protein
MRLHSSQDYSLSKSRSKMRGESIVRRAYRACQIAGGGDSGSSYDENLGICHSESEPFDCAQDKLRADEGSRHPCAVPRDSSAYGLRMTDVD